LRDAVGLGVSLRGVYPGGEAQARVLRAAAAVARSRHRLGKRVDEADDVAGGVRLRGGNTTRSRVPPGARRGDRSDAPVSRSEERRAKATGYGTMTIGARQKATFCAVVSRTVTWQS